MNTPKPSTMKKIIPNKLFEHKCKFNLNNHNNFHYSHKVQQHNYSNQLTKELIYSPNPNLKINPQLI